MSDVVATKGEGLRALWRLYGQGASQLWRGAVRGESRLTASSALAMSGEPHPALNFGVIDAGPEAERCLREAVACLRERALPGRLVLTDAVADELAPTAHDLGLARAGTTPLLARGPAEPPRAAAGFRVERVTGSDRLTDFVDVVAQGWTVPIAMATRAFGDGLLRAPGVDLFVACAGESAVSAAATTLTGATVGVWALSTVPEQRRHGAARALVAALLRQHRAAERFYLTAGTAGQRLYESLGFEAVAEGVAWEVAAP